MNDQLQLFPVNEAPLPLLRVVEVIASASKHTTCHHELSKDEYWLGNTRGITIPEHYKSLKTIRLGEQAYCIKGTPLDRNHYRPLILNKSEEQAYERIYAQLMSDASRGR